MRGKISIKFILIIFFLFTLSFRSAFSSVNFPISLKNVVFLREPENRLIFEFSNKPTYEILKEKNKLILRLSNTSVKNSKWISSLPRNIFREFNIALENEKTILEFTLTKDFQISSEAFENKLIVNLILDEKKITHARIVRDKIETFSLADAGFTPPNWPKGDDSPIKLPLTGNYTGAPISVDFQDADLRAIMRLFAEVGKINIVFAEPVNGTVTMRVSNVPWDLLFDVILNSFGLAKVNYNNLVVVKNISKLKDETKTLTEYLNSLREYEEAGPQTLRIFHLKYAKTNETAIKIQSLMKNTIITTFENSQVLLVKSPPKIMQEIERVIRTLDRPIPQILIEARLVEVSETYAHSLGVRWGGGAYRVTEKTLLGIGNLPNVNSTGLVSNNQTFKGGINIPAGPLIDLGLASAPAKIGFSIGYVDKSLTIIDLELSALEGKGHGKIFAKPRIVTTNNHPANFEQGYKIKYSLPGSNQTTEIDATTKLKVTPYITPDNRIYMDVDIERTLPDWSRTVQGVPSLYTTRASTRVLVRSGETFVIGGIRLDDIKDNTEGIPWLSNIPSVGNLFKRTDKAISKSEFMVFITPKIVTAEIEGVDY